MEPTSRSVSGPSRRDFLKQVAAVSTVAMVGLIASTTDAQQQPTPAAEAPWHRRALRWGQTNINEADVPHYDIAWWRQYWKRTEVQGVIINAGGIFAYYPSNIPNHYRAQTLGDRDLYGELAQAAHEDGLAVLARMDTRGGHADLYQAHPDWFAVNGNNQPYRNGDLYQACVNSAYYEEYVPSILREIIQRSHPEGLTDNSWSGLGRNSMCYCQNCARRFRDKTGGNLPVARNWNDVAYRQWIDWNYARRIELWELNNRVAREAGGRDCLWIGMNGGSITSQANDFRDYKEICARAEIIMLDFQNRGDTASLHENAQAGKLIHGLLGWDKLIPESMAMYQTGRSVFRFSSKPAAEARGWMLSGFAGGIQPWWHHIGAYQEDRRAFHTAQPVMQWHKANQDYLVNRRPLANVGVIWSQRNADFFGRDNVDELVDQPMHGFTQALVRARIPYLPVHIDHVERDAANLSVIVLPNLGSMSDAQAAAIRKFVDGGGSVVATGQTSLFDEWGEPRADFALADLLGIKGGKPEENAGGGGRNRVAVQHTYLRLAPELRRQVDGPNHGDEPAVAAGARRHPILDGLEETDLVAFGGTLTALSVDAGAQVLATFIPPFPVTPPETIWMRTPRTDVPGLVVREKGDSRIVYFPADLDRRYAVDNLPDHAALLANAVRWAAGNSLPLSIQGTGLLDCELYQQPGRLILHIVNLTSVGAWRAPVEETIPVGPLQVKIRLPKGASARSATTMVSNTGQPLAIKVEAGWLSFELKSVADHEMVVISV